MPCDVRSEVRGWPVVKPAVRAALVENWNMSLGIEAGILLDFSRMGL